MTNSRVESMPRRRHPFGGPSLWIAGAVAALLNAIPNHFVNGAPRRMGWPVHCVDLKPLVWEGKFTKQQEEFIAEDLWHRGLVGPTGARHGDSNWWYWARLRYGTVVTFCPVAIALNALVAAGSCVFLVCVVGAWRRHYDPRWQTGHCKQCGYNLTGNTSGRCPECGTTLG